MNRILQKYPRTRFALSGSECTKLSLHVGHAHASSASETNVTSRKMAVHDNVVWSHLRRFEAER